MYQQPPVRQGCYSAFPVIENRVANNDGRAPGSPFVARANSQNRTRWSHMFVAATVGDQQVATSRTGNRRPGTVFVPITGDVKMLHNSFAMCLYYCPPIDASLLSPPQALVNLPSSNRKLGMQRRRRKGGGQAFMGYRGIAFRIGFKTYARISDRVLGRSTDAFRAPNVNTR